MSRMSEIAAVKELGERIGYGNMMDLASALWSIMLEEKHGITSEPAVSTIPALMKKPDAKKAKKHLQERKEEINKILKGV